MQCIFENTFVTVLENENCIFFKMEYFFFFFENNKIKLFFIYLNARFIPAFFIWNYSAFYIHLYTNKPRQQIFISEIPQRYRTSKCIFYYVRCRNVYFVFCLSNARIPRVFAVMFVWCISIEHHSDNHRYVRF